MNKTRIVFICLLVPFFLLIPFVFLKIKDKEEFQRKVVLAQELRKVMERLVVDLRETHEDTIQDLPADGHWHNRIAFIQDQLGNMEYLVKGGRLFRMNNGKILMAADNIDLLRVRRQKAAPDILEIQIEAKKNVTLMSNLRIRILQ